MDGLTAFIEIIIKRTNSKDPVKWDSFENAFKKSQAALGSGVQGLLEQEQQEIWNSLNKVHTKAGFICAMSQFNTDEQRNSFLNKLKITVENFDALKYQKLFKFNASQTSQQDREQECKFLKKRYPKQNDLIRNIEQSIPTLYWSSEFIEFNALATIQYMFSVYKKCQNNIVTVKSATEQQLPLLEKCLSQHTTDFSVALQGATNFYAYNQSFKNINDNRPIVIQEFERQNFSNEKANFENDTIYRKEIQDNPKYNGFLIQQNQFWNDEYLFAQLQKSILKFDKSIQKAGVLIMFDAATKTNLHYCVAFKNYFNVKDDDELSSIDSTKLKILLTKFPPQDYQPTETEVNAEISWFIKLVDLVDLKHIAENLKLDIIENDRQKAAEKLPYLTVSFSILSSVLKKEKEEGKETKEESDQDSNLKNQIAAWENMDEDQKLGGFIATLARSYNSKKAGISDSVEKLLNRLQIPHPIEFKDLKKYQKGFKYQIEKLNLNDIKTELEYVKETYPEKQTDVNEVHDHLKNLKLTYLPDYEDFASVKYVPNQYEQCVIKNNVQNETLKSMTADEEVKVIECLSVAIDIPNKTFTAKGDLQYYLLKKQCYDFDTKKYDEDKMMQFAEKELSVRKMDKTLADLQNHTLRRVDVCKMDALANFLICYDAFWTLHREKELKYALQEYVKVSGNSGLLHIIADIYKTQNPEDEKMKIALENYVDRQKIFDASQAGISLMLTNHNPKNPQILSQQQIELEIDTLLRFSSFSPQKKALEQIKKYDVKAVENFKYLESSKFILKHKVFSKIKFDKLETKNTEDTESTLEVFINIAQLIIMYNNTSKNIAQDDPHRQFVLNQQKALKRLLQLYANADKLEGANYMKQFEEVNNAQFNAQNQNVLIDKINAMKLNNVLDYGTLLDPDFSDTCGQLTLILQDILSILAQEDCKNIGKLIKNTKDVQKLVVGRWTKELYPKFYNCISNYINHLVIAKTCPDTDELLNFYEILN